MTSTSLLAGADSITELLHSVGPVKVLSSCVGFLSLMALVKYRGTIRRRVKQIQEESWLFGAGVTMERVVEGSATIAEDGVFSDLRLLEMNPEFQAKCQQEGQPVISLGTYMAQLRPKGLPKAISMEEKPKLIQREIEAGLAAGLLKILGPQMGRVLLPAVGTGLANKRARGLAGSIAANWFLSSDKASSISASNDKGGIPVSLMTLLAISDVNAKVNSGNSTAVQDNSVPNYHLSAIDKMKVGEIVKGTPAFVQNLNDEFFIPNDFVVSRHFDAAIQGMEEILMGHDGDMTASAELQMAQDAGVQEEESHEDSVAYKNREDSKKTKSSLYDPEDRSLGEPVPVNHRLFPGLHLGWGDALNSHTKREILKMRLLSILLNKLGVNYYRHANKNTGELFQVRMTDDDNAKVITTPWELVQALIVSGHDVQVFPTSRMTTFGLALCVKERGDSWSNIPLGVFLETGYEDKNGNMAPAMMPIPAPWCNSVCTTPPQFIP